MHWVQGVPEVSLDSGNSLLHEELGAQLASLHKKEVTLVLLSCCVACDIPLLFISARQVPGCEIFSDADYLASITRGIGNRVVPRRTFKHGDPEHLEKMLSKVKTNMPKNCRLRNYSLHD